MPNSCARWWHNASSSPLIKCKQPTAISTTIQVQKLGGHVPRTQTLLQQITNERVGPLHESFVIGCSSLLFLWLLLIPRSKAEWTSHHFSLPQTWWRRSSSTSSPQSLTKLSILHTTPVILVQPSQLTPLLHFLLEDQRIEKIWLVGLANAFLIATWKAMMSWLPSFPFLPLHHEDWVEWSRYPAILRWFHIPWLKCFSPWLGMHFLPPFFCLSHKIIFVQSYVGFVCQKEQGPRGCQYKLSIVITL